MREHLGVDVDSLPEDDLMASEPTKPENEQKVWDPESEQERGKEGGTTEVKKSRLTTAPVEGGIDMVTDGTAQGQCSATVFSVLLMLAI